MHDDSITGEQLSTHGGDDVIGVGERFVRTVISAGREQRSTDTSLRPDAAAWRAVARLALGDPSVGDTDTAFDAFAQDPAGLTRLEAMIGSALECSRDTDGPAHDDVLNAAVDVLAAFASAERRRSHRRRDVAASLVQRMAMAVSTRSWVEACGEIVAGVRDVAGMAHAALYIPGAERARFELQVAEPDTGDEPPLPRFLRVDGGIAADALGATRVVSARDPERIGGLSHARNDARAAVAVPLRDDNGNAIGVIVAADPDPVVVSHDALDALRLAMPLATAIVAGSELHSRVDAALAALPELVDVPLDDVDTALDALAAVGARACSAAAVAIRLIDESGDALTTVALSAAGGDRGSGRLGGSSALDSCDACERGDGEREYVDSGDGETWLTTGLSHETTELVRNYSGRVLLSVPVRSRHGRSGCVLVVWKRPVDLGPVERACARIVAAHAQRALEAGIDAQQALRAIEMATGTVALLGEALVAGVDPDRTIRFIPRLAQRLFDVQWARVYRSRNGGEPQAVAGTGHDSHNDDDVLPGVAALVARAAERPGTIEELDVSGTFVAATAIRLSSRESLILELGIADGTRPGSGEQRLIIEVADRIGQALRSGMRARRHRAQLERFGGLQGTIANAFDELSTAHVGTTVVREVRERYAAAGAALVLVGDDGRRTISAASGLAVSDPDWFLAQPAVPPDKRIGIADPAPGAAAGTQAALDASVTVPLITRQQTIGALVLGFTDAVPAELASDANMLSQFGEHIAAALSNARTHEREQAVRQRLQRTLDGEREASRQIQALYEVSRTFATSLSLDDTMRAVVEALADRLDIDAVWLRTPDDRGDQFVMRAFHAVRPELGGALERIIGANETRTDPLVASVLTTRRPVVLDAVRMEREFAGATLATMLLPFLHTGSSVAVIPVATPTKVLGLVTLLSLDPQRRIDAELVQTAVGVASQAALALDNARLYKEQKHFADVIQESLLPSSLPSVDGIDLGVLYRSATSGGSEVGGDFYDFLPLSDGRLAMVVGDVCGKGVAAAADTAMTKYIFRALAREHDEPGMFLHHANEVVCEEITANKFVTLVHAVIDPRRGTLRYAKAGHPAPKLLRRESGGEISVESLEANGLALGIMPGQDYEQFELAFPAGSSLVSYTDGVVEARRGGRLYGQFRLERLLSDVGADSAPQIAFEMYRDCEAYAEDGLADDVAIVVAQHTGVTQ